MKLLQIDIETAPNLAHVWGLWKQNVGLSQLMDTSYTLCFAAKWVGKKEVIFKTHKDADMLDTAWRLLDEADAVIHYNGKRFDIPTLNKEFIQSGLGPPSTYHQIDLLQVARKMFRFPSNKLDYVAKALGVGGKVKHIGHELWVRCMNDDEKAWNLMRRYNIQDVHLLEKVYLKMLPWIDSHPNHALYSDNTRTICTNCGSGKVHKRGTEHTKAFSYQRYKCTKCGTNLRGKVNTLSKEKRQSLLTQAKL